MLIARKAKDKREYRDIVNILKLYNLDWNMGNASLSFILEENEIIIGGCNFYFFQDKAIINFLVIDKNKTEENLGDGLLRAALNYCLIKGIKNAYYLSSNDYFIKKGFVENKELIKEFSDITDFVLDSVLECNIEEFLRKKHC